MRAHTLSKRSVFCTAAVFLLLRVSCATPAGAPPPDFNNPFFAQYGLRPTQPGGAPAFSPAPMAQPQAPAAGAGTVCDSLTLSDDRRQCQANLQGHSVDPRVANLCGTMTSSADRLGCLMSARDKTYSDGDISACSRGAPLTRRSCIANSGALPAPQVTAAREPEVSAPSAPSAPSSPSTSSSTTMLACCINQQVWLCPNAATLDRCAGAASRCLTECMERGGDCDRCVKLFDPSGCQRDSSLDGNRTYCR